jgi:hypothetical protein
MEKIHIYIYRYIHAHIHTFYARKPILYKRTHSSMRTHSSIRTHSKHAPQTGGDYEERMWDIYDIYGTHIYGTYTFEAHLKLASIMKSEHAAYS